MRPPACLPPLHARCALFLDFDGTLAELAPQPESVRVSPELVETLTALQQILQGAVAIITGRPIEQIDALLHPLLLPVAGVHGVERRRADGGIERLAAPFLQTVEEQALALAADAPGLRVERKPGAVALHYRQAPDEEARCLEVMKSAVALSPGLTLLRGKMVLEAKPKGATKGHAIRSFLGEAPFRERHPVFAGDDITDEAGFELLRELSGTTIKVGEGSTVAEHRLASPADVRAWLALAHRKLQQPTGDSPTPAAALAGPR